MSSCLGIYVDKNLIKYAKLNKNKDTFKVEAFNVETFENLEEALKKVIVETNSYKVPISINISNELYNYFDVFAILEKKDITKSLDIEFEMLCNEKGYDKKSLESRYILMDNREDYEKYKALYISANKKEIDEKIEYLSNNKLIAMMPVSTSITNLIDVSEAKENIAIINIENETQITTIIDGQINRVDVLNSGIGDVTEQINRVELSWKKTYDVFKNITIYDHEVTNLDENENLYIDIVLPVLNKIAKETKKLIGSFKEKISKIYITGTGATIGNIDIYFEDFFKDTKCEILKPFFIDPSSLKLPTKEYIEVNSAISLALDGLGFMNKDLNFAPISALDNIDIENIINSKEKFNIEDWKKPFSITEKLLLRGIAVFIIGIISFSCFSKIITDNSNRKIEETSKKLAESTNQINTMDNYLNQIKGYTTTYSELISSVDDLSEITTTSQNNRVISKDAIPNLLNKLMFIIPKQVQITSIENTEENHIVIEAESEKYEQLGYFVAAIKNDGMLQNIQSSSGTKSDSLVQITIEGDLP